MSWPSFLFSPSSILFQLYLGIQLNISSTHLSLRTQNWEREKKYRNETLDHLVDYGRTYSLRHSFSSLRNEKNKQLT